MILQKLKMSLSSSMEFPQDKKIFLKQKEI